MERNLDLAHALCVVLTKSPDVVFGGYTEDLSPEDLGPAFRDVLDTLAAGEVSDIVAADYGFHLFHVKERRPAATLSWEEAVPLVTLQLQGELADRALGDMLRVAEALYPVTVLGRNLPFLWDVEKDSDASTD